MEKETPKTDETIVPEESGATITPETPDAPAEETNEQMKQRLAEFEFKEKISEVSQTYPHAADFKDEIKSKVAQGYSIEDASIIILNSKGKLQTAEQIARARNASGSRSSGIGGSMDNSTPSAKKEPKPGEAGAVEFYAERFKELEAKGEIRIA